MNVTELKRLGFTEQEAKIYLALVSLGKSSASLIVREAGVSYGTIYEILAQMDRKGLVKIVPEKTKKFIATDPEKLMELVKENEIILKNIKQGIKELKKRYDQEELQPIVVAQGRANFYKLRSEMSKPVTRDFSVRPVLEYRPVSWRKMKKQRKEGIDFKILYGPKAMKENIRRFRKEGVPLIEFPVDRVSILVNDDEVVIGLKEKNSTVLIKDKNFSDVMAWFFKCAFK